MLFIFKMNLDELKLNIKWWESKRWIFNLLVGIVGVYAIYDGIKGTDYSWSRADTFGLIYWGIGANIFYSLGILSELFDWYYFKNRLGIKRFRLFLYISGTLFSCLWTFWCTWIYFSELHLW